MEIMQALLLRRKPLAMSVVAGTEYETNPDLHRAIAEAVTFARAGGVAQVMVVSRFLPKDQEGFETFIQTLLRALQVGEEELAMQLELVVHETLKLTITAK